MTKSNRNLYGQTIGDKGRQTRERILKATTELLERRSIREMKVAEIGAQAGISSSAFYLYFDSVTAAALAVVEQINQATPELMAVLDREWTADTVHDDAREFVRIYMGFWQKHQAVLLLRNFAADEGDRRFFEARRLSIEPIHFALQEKIGVFQEREKEQEPAAIRLHAPSTVSVLLAMLERTATIIRLPSAHKATRARQVDAAAFLLASAVIGRTT